MIFYGGAPLLIAILFRILWEAVLRDRSLLRPDVTPAEIAVITKRATPNVVGYVDATLLAIPAALRGGHPVPRDRRLHGAAGARLATRRGRDVVGADARMTAQ